MKKTLEKIKNEYLTKINQTNQLSDLEELKIFLLGKKGLLTHQLKQITTMPIDERPILGKLANETKKNLLEAFKNKHILINKVKLEASLKESFLDISLPEKQIPIGKKHPIAQTIEEVCNLFSQLGFSTKEGPDIESEYYNFEALNIPTHHPARDMHDTFYLNTQQVLRTHTSPVQIRTMEKKKAPLKIIVPGKVYRCDADVTHSPVFHQIEGLCVGNNISFSQLKGTLEYFLKAVFGKDKKIRFRPSYFPFTEPSTEVDVEFIKEYKKGSQVIKEKSWLEILGAGMIHPNVFKSVNYDSKKVKGFAFGLGIERIAMLKYNIPDIRLFYENDSRFLEQF